MEINEDYIKIGQRAAKHFRQFLSNDEIMSCIYMGIVKAINNHDERSKLTTYIYNNIRWECLDQIKFNTKYVLDFDLDKIPIDNTEYKEEVFDEILYDRLVHEVPVSELCKKYGKTEEEINKEIRNKKSILKNLYLFMNNK